jgi:hypothetical protein
LILRTGHSVICNSNDAWGPVGICDRCNRPGGYLERNPIILAEGEQLAYVVSAFPKEEGLPIYFFAGFTGRGDRNINWVTQPLYRNATRLSETDADDIVEKLDRGGKSWDTHRIVKLPA